MITRVITRETLDDDDNDDGETFLHIGNGNATVEPIIFEKVILPDRLASNNEYLTEPCFSPYLDRDSDMSIHDCC